VLEHGEGRQAGPEGRRTRNDEPRGCGQPRSTARSSSARQRSPSTCSDAAVS
jgi:hypothetical protein